MVVPVEMVLTVGSVCGFYTVEVEEVSWVGVNWCLLGCKDVDRGG